MLEVLEGGAPQPKSNEEEPLQLPAVGAYAAALIDLPTVELDGEKASVKQVMLEAYPKTSVDHVRTRVDIRNLNFSVPIPTRSWANTWLPCELPSTGPTKFRKVLQNFTFSLLPGETTLLLGGPRSGKTALLEAIAGRQVQGVTGEIFVNGASPHQAYQRMVSYAMQGDCHASRLTVRETLTFAAWCQMPTADEHYIERRVEAVLQMLGLKHAENTLVGGMGVPGVSGGEKRRCTIGIEWVKGPRFFLLDEPTTGLDSGAAMNVGRCLRAISQIGTPVLCALLQPSWDLVTLFDKIVMIAEGQIVYWGPISDVLRYFASLGFHCPLNYSASEFLSEVIDHPRKFTQDIEAAAARKIETSADFVTAWNDSEMRTRMLALATGAPVSAGNQPSSIASAIPPPLLTTSVPPSLKDISNQVSGGSLVSLAGGEQARENFARSPMKQYQLLMWRGYLLMTRDWRSLLQQLIADLFLSIVMGLLFFQMGTTLAESRAIFGLVWFLVSRLSFQSLATMAGAYVERPYFTRQRAAQYYQMIPYTAATVSLMAPPRMLLAVIFTTIVYWLAGLFQTAGHFFFMLLVIAVQGASFVVFAQAVASSVGDPLNASLAASTFVVLLILFSGFIIIRPRIPKPYIWAYYLTPMKYAGDALNINEFHGRQLKCAANELSPPSDFVNFTLPYPDGFNGAQICHITTGDELLRSRGVFPYSHLKWVYLAAMLGFFLLFCALYYAAVRYFRWPTRNVGGRPPLPPSKDADKGKKKARANPHSATLSWNQLEYSVPLPNGNRISLLNKVNGYVRPGMLLALMGPSGAGKTTLLDVLAARKNVGIVSGDVRINGKPLSDTYPRLIGYVEQFDMHFPLQTVQEALWFAAHSRLPSALSREQKMDIVNDIVSLLEMEPLRHMLVAALNPEEQKRLSMGVELSSLPAVLFLDEPTSGLDSNGADRVMAAIEKIAQSGTSVICTIHQPSSRIFFRASHLLLLRYPGKVVYFGELGPNANTVIQYFRNHGLSCPPGMNPADFVLECSLGRNPGANLGASAPSAASVVAGTNQEPIVPVIRAPSADLTASWDASPSAAQLASFLANVDKEAASEAGNDPIFEESLKHRYALGWFSQFGLLLNRWMRALWRAPRNTVITVMRATLIGFVFGTVFFQRPHDQQGASERVSVMFIAAIFSFLTAFAYIPAFYIQRAIFYRERAEVMYKVSSWGISRAIMDLPGVLIGNFIIAILLYWLAGLRPNAGAFFFFLLTILIFGCVALVFAQMLSAIFAYIDVVGLVFSSIFATFALSAGFLLPRPQIRVWMRWMYWMSYTRYYLEALVVNEFKGDTFHCNRNGDFITVPVHQNGSLFYKDYCPITSGQQMLSSLGLYESLHYYDVLVLAGFWVAMMCVFLISLRVFKHIKR